MRRVAAVVASMLVAAALISCSDDRSADDSADGAIESDDLPFGLRVVDGTEAIGRPAVVDDPAYSFFKDEPVPARRFQAAFWVTSEDPVAVVRAWVDQLDRLAFDEVTIQRGHSPEHWVQVSGGIAFVPDGPLGDWADLQLWATSRAPVLLVSINKIEGEAREPVVTDRLEDSSPPNAVIEGSERDEGDVLFVEQGDTIHLPVGSQLLMPAIPTHCGTGGSTSLLAAADPLEAVAALLDEASALRQEGEVTGPTESVMDGVRVVTGSFVITAGGWSFRIVAVRGPDDRAATVYVTSCAD